MSHERKPAFVLGVSDSVRLAPVEPGLPYHGAGNRSVTGNPTSHSLQVGGSNCVKFCHEFYELRTFKTTKTNA